MSTIYVDADAWDALDPTEHEATFAEANVPVTLGSPAELFGGFTDDEFVPDAELGARWYAWDDHRLTEAHAVAIAIALED
jgi:hypothetical protein